MNHKQNCMRRSMMLALVILATTSKASAEELAP